MSIDYKQLQEMVKEAMFTGGGINEPSAPEGVPHRMPAADGADKQQDMGDPEANEKYEIALQAREATEQLVEALDQPIFDGAYEHAFKASACLRRALNAIEEAGAHPMPMQRVVAPPAYQQKYTGSGMADYAGGGMMGSAEAMEEGEEALKGRSAKVAQAASMAGTQTAEQLEQQLTSVLGGDGINPVHLRTALGSLLTKLGIKQGPQIGTVVAKAVAAQKKKKGTQ
jgi:hypothetical protein